MIVTPLVVRVIGARAAFSRRRTREASSTAASGEEGAVPDAAAHADAPLPSVPRARAQIRVVGTAAGAGRERGGA